jgi:hypothetical protein
MSRAYDSAEGRAEAPNLNAAGESVPLLIDARRAQMCTFAEISGKRRDAETPGFAECEFPGTRTAEVCVVQARAYAHRLSAGWNGLDSLTFKTLDLAEPDKILEKHQKLGQYMATPIAGELHCLIPRAMLSVSFDGLRSRQRYFFVHSVHFRISESAQWAARSIVPAPGVRRAALFSLRLLRGTAPRCV